MYFSIDESNDWLTHIVYCVYPEAEQNPGRAVTFTHEAHVESIDGLLSACSLSLSERNYTATVDGMVLNSWREEILEGGERMRIEGKFTIQEDDDVRKTRSGVRVKVTDTKTVTYS